MSGDDSRQPARAAAHSQASHPAFVARKRTPMVPRRDRRPALRARSLRGAPRSLTGRARRAGGRHPAAMRRLVLVSLMLAAPAAAAPRESLDVTDHGLVY